MRNTIISIFRDERERINQEIINLNGAEKKIVVSYFQPFVIIVPVTTSKDLLMLKQYRHGVQKEVLGFPGGFIDNGETPGQAAKRELYEETGYKATKLKMLGKLFENPARSRNPFYVFIAYLKDTKDIVINPDKGEFPIKSIIIDTDNLEKDILKTYSANTMAAYLLYKLKEK